MRIGVILSQPPTYSETFFVSKIKGLIKDGFEVFLFVQEGDSEFNLCKVFQAPKIKKQKVQQILQTLTISFGLIPYGLRVSKFLKLEKKSGRSMKQRFKNVLTNAHLIKAKVDWLHFGFGTLVIQSENVAQAIGAKMAVSFRGFDICIYPLKHQNCYEILWKKVDKVHVISNDILKLALSNGMPDDIPYKKITPAIHLNSFNNSSNNNINNILQITTIARLHWKKGLIETIEALAELKKAKIQFEYHIIGAGPQYEELRFAIFQLNLESEVFLDGKMNQMEIIKRLSETDIYIQYSVSEGFCNALIEAQAMGCLCIGSNAEGIAENIVDGYSGFVIEKNNVLLLYDKLREVIAFESEKKKKIAAQAISHVSTNFDINKQINQFIKFYSVLE